MLYYRYTYILAVSSDSRPLWIPMSLALPMKPSKVQSYATVVNNLHKILFQKKKKLNKINLFIYTSSIQPLHKMSL